MLTKKRKANRLKGYNYRNEKLYFVTICVHDRMNYYGNVSNEGTMHLNQFGLIAEKQWNWLVSNYTYLYSHAFIVMPNHIHAILEINTNLVENVGTSRDLSMNTTKNTDCDLSTNDEKRTSHDLSLHNITEPIKIKPLSQLIGAYKTTTSKQIHIAGGTDFQWQRSFYDHIIRNEKSFNNITAYINENPLNWITDKYYE